MSCIFAGIAIADTTTIIVTTIFTIRIASRGICKSRTIVATTIRIARGECVACCTQVSTTLAIRVVVVVVVVITTSSKAALCQT